ncbi:MAG: ribose-phosphate pyrophosphokinase-like domain-containing protein [Burkholderiales bacterium]|nr:ribose-phosphate pyrophosphokinase-like domain-containing protein [Burkholderiales bacterium]
MTVWREPILVAGDAHPALARALAHLAGLPLRRAASIAAFADGETRVRIEEEVGGRDVVLVQPTSPPVNDRLMTLALRLPTRRARPARRASRRSCPTSATRARTCAGTGASRARRSSRRACSPSPASSAS